jgi:L-glyceraldehyde 3-phosphate reductase
VSYAAAPERYDRMPYRQCGRSGLKLPAISLGLWQNFGTDRPLDTAREIVRRAFDLGVTHFDLANNYGPPYGAAEETFGRLFASDLAPYRDELIVSTKAGWDMWPGPYGDGGSRKYLLASLDQSLARMGLDYVDIFYSHRRDHDTPLDETIGALDTAVRSGKALYAGISMYGADSTDTAVAIAQELHLPLMIHQPVYSIFNRWLEREGVLDACERNGLGVIVFSPLAQGLLSDRYLNGIPEDSRAMHSRYFSRDDITEEKLAKVRELNELAKARGQSLAQMALAWTLRDSRVTSALPGASSVAQLEANVAAADNVVFSDDELSAIDRIAPVSG